VGGILQTEGALGVGTRYVSDYLDRVVGRIGWAPSPLELPATAATLLLSLLAVAWAYLVYARPRFRPWSARLPWAQALLEHKYYFDELYDWALVRPLDRVAHWGDRDVDRRVIDGSLTGLAGWVRGGGRELGQVESGYFRSYILVFVGGALVAGLVVLWRAST
jgi:NADH:ubiquinone oxidoreductase subunit 5 (subunit L)/multisubunit Na+/H+ antiporter MnhA subunit